MHLNEAGDARSRGGDGGNDTPGGQTSLGLGDRLNPFLNIHSCTKTQ